MTLINPSFSIVGNYIQQSNLPVPESLFSNSFATPYQPDSFNFSSNQVNKPVLMKPAELNKSFFGTVSNIWNKVKNTTVNAFTSNPTKNDIVLVKDSQGKNVKVKAEIADNFNKLVDVAKQKGVKVKVNSSYRSVDEQTSLWNKALKKYGSVAKARKWVAPPGKSRHNKGVAIDLNMYKNGKKIPQKEFDTIIAKAGFYRPMSYEGWHIEPISTAKSRNINLNNTNFA